MFLVGVLELAVREHLDLVELVDADDAARVLAIAPSFAAVARAPPGVAQGPIVEVENFVAVIARERDLARADEVEVVVLVEVLDLIGVFTEEAGAIHRFR